jgi:hypothetical protein
LKNLANLGKFSNEKILCIEIEIIFFRSKLGEISQAKREHWEGLLPKASPNLRVLASRKSEN